MHLLNASTSFPIWHCTWQSLTSWGTASTWKLDSLWQQLRVSLFHEESPTVMYWLFSQPVFEQDLDDLRIFWSLLWSNSFKILVSREVHRTREDGNLVDYDTKIRVRWEVIYLFIYSLIKSRKDSTIWLIFLKVLKVTRLKKKSFKK